MAGGNDQRERPPRCGRRFQAPGPGGRGGGPPGAQDPPEHAAGHRGQGEAERKQQHDHEARGGWEPAQLVHARPDQLPGDPHGCDPPEPAQPPWWRVIAGRRLADRGRRAGCGRAAVGTRSPSVGMRCPRWTRRPRHPRAGPRPAGRRRPATHLAAPGGGDGPPRRRRRRGRQGRRRLGGRRQGRRRLELGRHRRCLRTAQQHDGAGRNDKRADGATRQPKQRQAVPAVGPARRGGPAGTCLSEHELVGRLAHLDRLSVARASSPVAALQPRRTELDVATA